MKPDSFIKIECIFNGSEDDENNFEDLGIKTEYSETIDDVRIRRKHITDYYPTMDPTRTRVFLVSGREHLVNLPVRDFEEILFSTKQKEAIV